MTITTGELCHGIAYINWEHISNGSSPSEKQYIRCVGKHQKFALDHFNFDHSLRLPQAKTKYVRAIGSTAVLLSPPDVLGRRKAVAHSLGPLVLEGVQVGSVEESLVDLACRVQEEGARNVLLDPACLLFKRAALVGERSLEILKSSLLPLPQFITKMRNRIPELVQHTYDIASSIRIEIKIEEIDNDPDDKSK